MVALKLRFLVMADLGGVRKLGIPLEATTRGDTVPLAETMGDWAGSTILVLEMRLPPSPRDTLFVPLELRCNANFSSATAEATGNGLLVTGC